MDERKDVAIFVLIHHEPRLLLLMEWRDDWPPAPGAWVFPGGKREAAEDIESTVVREAQEELGISIMEMQPLGEVSSISGWVNTPFLVTDWDGSVPLLTDNGDRLHWATPEEALASTWPPAAEIARRALACLAGNVTAAS